MKWIKPPNLPDTMEKIRRLPTPPKPKFPDQPPPGPTRPVTPPPSIIIMDDEDEAPTP